MHNVTIVLFFLFYQFSAVTPEKSMLEGHSRMKIIMKLQDTDLTFMLC